MINNTPLNILKFKMDFDVQGIHKTSVRILEEIGIKIRSKKALSFLDSLGCQVDYDSFQVRIPESLINKALSHKIKSFKLYDRRGESFVNYGDNNLLFTTGPLAIRIKEFNNKYRNATYKDLEKITKIQDFYDIIDIIYPTVVPSDIKQENLFLKMAIAVLKNTKKSCWFAAPDPVVVEDIFKIGIAIRGSKEELTKKPFFIINCMSDSVLGFQEKEVETLIRCAELGIPSTPEHYPVMGLTAPTSISGALAINNANFLCGHIIKTFIDPKNPSVYPVMAGSFNMKNGEIITSSPEIWLYYLAGIKLGQYYEIPTFVSLGTDSKEIDSQMAYEKTMGYLISACAGVNNIVGATCSLDSFNLASYEQIVIDLEFLSTLSKFLKGFIIEQSETDYEIIKRSLNNKMFFLGDVHTLKNYKNFIQTFELFVKDNFVNWKKSSKLKLKNKAHKKVNEIFKNNLVPGFSLDILKEINKIEQQSLKK